MYLEAYSQSQRLLQHASTLVTPGSPLENPIDLLVTQLQRQYPQMATIFSYEELARVCTEYVQYGSYWQRFRSALQTDEVLLIDPTYSFDPPNPSTTVDIAEQIWLCQGLGLRQFCHRLSGLSQMISDLARTEFNSAERMFLATKIPDRLAEVLGPDPTTYISALHEYPVSPTSFYPSFAPENSPIETVDGDIFSLPGSIGAEGSDDGYSSLDGGMHPPIFPNPFFTASQIPGSLHG
jgi:hypothetical protein